MIDEIEIYKLYETLPIWKAAALILGINPSDVEVKGEELDSGFGSYYIEITYMLKDNSMQGQFEAVMGAIMSSANTLEQVSPKPCTEGDSDVPF